jgi:hypothetical protein
MSVYLCSSVTAEEVQNGVAVIPDDSLGAGVCRVVTWMLILQEIN